MASVGLGKLAVHTVQHTKGSCTASVIFLHGFGENGSSMRERILRALGREWTFPHIRVLYPTANLRNINAEHKNAWIGPNLMMSESNQHKEIIHPTSLQITRLVEEEIRHCVPRHRIVIGGFGEGGVLSLHGAFSSLIPVTATFCLSASLPDNSNLIQKIQESAGSKTLPSLFQVHGEDDDVIPKERAARTFSQLRDAGISGEFYVIPGLRHELNEKVIRMLSDWIERVLPAEF